MPAVTPPPVTRLRSTQTRVLVGVAPNGARFSIADQCVVARYPLSNPAAPSTSDPVQTEVMYLAPSACLRKKSSISSSLTMSSVPKPPGTQITSSCGQSAKVMVGVSIITESLATGSIRFQIRCTFAPGTLENTCKGPVKSSWVTFGKSTRPISSGADMMKAFRGLRSGQQCFSSLPGLTRPSPSQRLFRTPDSFEEGWMPGSSPGRTTECDERGCGGRSDT